MLFVKGAAITVVVVLILNIRLELLCIGLCECVSKCIIEPIVSFCV